MSVEFDIMYGFVITSYDCNEASFSSLLSETLRMLTVTLRFLIYTGKNHCCFWWRNRRGRLMTCVSLARWTQDFPKTLKCCQASKLTTSGLLLFPVEFSESTGLEFRWLGSVPGTAWPEQAARTWSIYGVFPPLAVNLSGYQHTQSMW